MRYKRMVFTQSNAKPYLRSSGRSLGRGPTVESTFSFVITAHTTSPIETTDKKLIHFPRRAHSPKLLPSDISTIRSSSLWLWSPDSRWEERRLQASAFNSFGLYVSLTLPFWIMYNADRHSFCKTKKEIKKID